MYNENQHITLFSSNSLFILFSLLYLLSPHLLFACDKQCTYCSLSLGIVNYMLEQSKPPATEVTSMKELNRILKADNPPVVVLCSEEMVDSFFELANAGRESFLIFKHLPSAALCGDIGLEMGTAGILMPYL